jgi:hypothetical protein
MIMITMPGIRPVVTALVLLAPLTAAQADMVDFRGEGALTVLAIEQVKEGLEYAFTVDGSGEPTGDFTGNGSFFLGKPSGVILGGDLTLTDQAGDTVHVYFEGQAYANGLFLTRFDVLDGTGAYAGATGEGYLLGDLDQDPVPIAFDGYLQLP